MRDLRETSYKIIRARESCNFTPTSRCQDWCGYHPEVDGKVRYDLCTLLAEVPAGETPRDWYVRMLNALRHEQAVVPCL